MAKVEIRKKLAAIPSKIYGYHEDDNISEEEFLPVYKVYFDDVCKGSFLNIYEAARNAEKLMDVDTIEIAYEKNPNAFKSILLNNYDTNIEKL